MLSLLWLKRNIIVLAICVLLCTVTYLFLFGINVPDPIGLFESPPNSCYQHVQGQLRLSRTDDLYWNTRGLATNSHSFDAHGHRKHNFSRHDSLLQSILGQLADDINNYERTCRAKALLMFRYSYEGFGSQVDGFGHGLSWALLTNKTLAFSTHSWLWSPSGCSVGTHTCWFKQISCLYRSPPQPQSPYVQTLTRADAFSNQTVEFTYAFPPVIPGVSSVHSVMFSASAVGYMLRPSEDLVNATIQYEKQLDLPTKYIAIHVRRGDANYERWHSLNVYIRIARFIALSLEDIRTIVVVTDSPDMIYEEAKAYPEFEFIFATKSYAVRARSESHIGLSWNLEHHQLDSESASQWHLLVKANYFIGTVSSFSRAAFAARLYQRQTARDSFVCDRIPDGRAFLRPVLYVDSLGWFCNDCDTSPGTYCYYCKGVRTGGGSMEDIARDPRLEMDLEDTLFGRMMALSGKSKICP
mmetsp:Transcript_38094/g.61686  ORF Transcript_38094/g.61686 Transcript_38094/m.61686 type:complete len:469 (-) Transcript_38094:853-2259(-)